MLCGIRATRKPLIMVLGSTSHLMLWYKEQHIYIDGNVLRATRKLMVKILKGNKRTHALVSHAKKI